MGRKGGGSWLGKRTLARDFKGEPRENSFKPGTGSEAPHRAGAAGSQPDGKWDISPEGLRNEAFEAYYKAQGNVPAEEWEAFLQCLQTPLPATFRVSGSGKFATAVRDTLRNNFVAAIAKLQPDDTEGESILPPFPLPWCVRREGCSRRLPCSLPRSLSRPLSSGTRTSWPGR